MMRATFGLFIAAALCSPALLKATEAPVAERVAYRNSMGQTLVFDGAARFSRGPGKTSTVLRDCSDAYQWCLTDGHGFAFAYVRKCTDAGDEGWRNRLRFHSKVISALHDHVWMVFDESPNYLFHYRDKVGIVGIIVGATPSYDFRSLLHETGYRMFDYEPVEFKVVEGQALAPCSE
ncbi:hypothetical protein EYV96_13160 [Dyella terrae]|nr:hypothetical protein [Dyella soli]TBR36850.1 hypothetical protein EYV96_13160 [Dyella terrae]